MSVILLATDLDDTLVGNNASLQQFNQIVSKLRSQQKVKLVYVTGRSPESFRELQAREPLPEPDALVAAVGTEIYLGDEQRILNWPQVSNWDIQKIKSLLAHIPALELQPTHGQRQYKVGYFLENNKQALHLVEEALKDYPVEIVYCQGIYLDILPKGSHKGGSIRFLSKLWNIDARNIITCGDSGNDISMLEGNKAVIVGNAKKELLEWAASSRLTNTYMAHNKYASGIIEGLTHYKVIHQDHYARISN